MLNRLKKLPDRWGWLRLVLDVQRRFSEVNGGFVAGAVTLALFLSLFPLILFSIAVFGFFASNAATDIAGEIISQLGLTGTAAAQMRDAIETAQQSKRSASLIGLAGLLWAGLGVVGAFEYAIDSVWQVTGRGLKDKLYALAWLAGAGLLAIASLAFNALLNFLPGFAAPLTVLAGTGVYIVMFWWTFQVLASRDIGWRPLLPGAVAGGIGFQVLTILGAVVVPRTVASSSALYGSIGVVFALLAWLFFFGRLLVYASVLNVVLFERNQGTVTVEMEVPHVPGEVALGANRSGAVVERTPAEE
ncbi:hypothetical protein BH18ACT4_BH18ACT4_08020 [soil metagenome]